MMTPQVERLILRLEARIQRSEADAREGLNRPQSTIRAYAKGEARAYRTAIDEIKSLLVYGWEVPK